MRATQNFMMNLPVNFFRISESHRPGLATFLADFSHSASSRLRHLLCAAVTHSNAVGSDLSTIPSAFLAMRQSARQFAFGHDQSKRGYLSLHPTPLRRITQAHLPIARSNPVSYSWLSQLRRNLTSVHPEVESMSFAPSREAIGNEGISLYLGYKSAFEEIL